MEDKTPRSPRPQYTGRFADPAQSAPPRTGAPLKPRASAAGGAARRPSGFAAPEAQKKRPEARPAQKGKAESKPAPKNKAEEKPAREKKVRNKRGARVKLELWQLGLIAVVALALVIVALVLIFGGGKGGTYHQLPRVERGSDSAYEPESTAAAGTDAAAGEEQAGEEQPAAADPNAAFENMFSAEEQGGGEVPDADMSEFESAFEGMDPGAFDDADAAAAAAGLLESGALDVGELDASDFSEASELFDTGGLDGAAS